ncbi:MAG: hypothetical protein D4R67_05010 [Bacteroidetes bacterium]|nr:MAG: hypothetical protein D4R67_05010 [Bacteroidota bacterium]
MLERWQADSIKHLRDHGIELKLIIVKASGKEPVLQNRIRSKINRLFSRNALFYFFDRYFLHPESKRIVNYTDEATDIYKLFCTPEKRKYISFFHEKDLQTIREIGPHFLLRFGFGIIGGEILTIPQYGIWSFHHGDEMKYRGGPPGFWEILNNEPVTGVILQRLNERLDKGFILRKGWFKTQRHSYKGQLDQLYLQTTRWPLQVCIAIQNGTHSEWLSDSKAPLYRAPGNVTIAKFLYKLIWNRLMFHFNELTRAEDWNIGIIHRAIHDIVKWGWDPEEVQWFPKPKLSKFVADPFLLEIDGRSTVFFEYYSYRRSKGELYSMDICDMQSFPKQIRKALQTENHSSFPFVFSFQGEYFLIPETHQDNRIVLYSLNHDTGQFGYNRTLVDHMSGVDPVILHYQNKWWLFFTRKDLPSVHLYIYYSQSLFDKFISHSNNPVKTDIRSSRPAGSFIRMDGWLIRPAQDCSWHYGARIVLNHVLKLSPFDFQEEKYLTVCPKGNYYSEGLHTINGNDRITIIDGKEFRFLWSNFFHGLKRIANNRIGITGIW